MRLYREKYTFFPSYLLSSRYSRAPSQWKLRSGVTKQALLPPLPTTVRAFISIVYRAKISAFSSLFDSRPTLAIDNWKIYYRSHEACRRACVGNLPELSYPARRRLSKAPSTARAGSNQHRASRQTRKKCNKKRRQLQRRQSTRRQRGGREKKSRDQDHNRVAFPPSLLLALGVSRELVAAVSSMKSSVVGPAGASGRPISTQ